MMSSAPERIDGITSGMVILRVMVNRSAPEMRADSSSVGSIRSSAPLTWMKTKGKLVLDESDATIADLMTDGCNMGIKSLHRCLNQYAEADEKAKDIAKRLINIEEKLTVDIRSYL